MAETARVANSEGPVDALYPPSPEAVPPGLTRPSRRYRRQAWLAFLGLFGFVAAYIGLSYWFLRTAYYLFAFGGEGPLPVLLGIASGFLGIFLVKGLFGLTRSPLRGDIELKRDEQPELMAFIDRLADEARAPRPHRVFVSARVNAAVFYDLSLLNLIFPSKKNLEIGLGLVNGLNLSEFKAVLAHEFGHFGQRSMAVGRWVYIAQQIAGNIISKRDFFDKALRFLSGIDLRIAWIGWSLRILVWCVRSIMDTFFGLVVLAQRSLSREMEFQADLVAVSLTGSDALIHALHRLGALDDAFDQAVSFSIERKRKGGTVGDVFEIQSRILNYLAKVMDDPNYGKSPRLEVPHAERVFELALAEPPRMWSTHPSNRDREDNTKLRYVPCGSDERSSWILFNEPGALRRRVTAQFWSEVFVSPEGPELTPEELRAALLERFEIPSLDKRYQGLYLGRSPVLGAKHLNELFHKELPKESELKEGLARIYPVELKKWLEELKVAEQEFHSLRLLKEGVLTAPGGIIQHKGRVLRRGDLPEATAEASREFEEKKAVVERHHIDCRSVHQAVAMKAGGGWAEYHRSLVALLHFVAHQSANIEDALGHFRNTMAVVLADGRVSQAELQRLIASGEDLWRSLERARSTIPPAELPAEVLARLEATSYFDVFGEELGLNQPNESNINDWVRIVDGWVNATLNPLGRIEAETLQCLLELEDRLRLWHERGVSLDPEVPAPAKIMAGYPTMAPGEERERQKKLDLWDRFQAADGVGPTLARLAVAAGIIGALLGFTRPKTDADLRIVNGLDTSIAVEVGKEAVTLGPKGHLSVLVERDVDLKIRAKTQAGELIEEFEETIDLHAKNPLYNVAGAAPLVTWYASYGSSKSTPPTLHGAPRWTTAEADYLFEKPPQSISTSGGGDSRSVFEALYNEGPGTQLANLPKDQARSFIQAHITWDARGSKDLVDWIMIGTSLAMDLGPILEKRLAKDPRDLVVRRARQDLPGSHEKACQNDRADAAKDPDDPDLAYLATRCLPDSTSDAGFEAVRAKFPAHPWIAWADSVRALRGFDYEVAEQDLRTARVEPSLCGDASLLLARILRRRSGVSVAIPDELSSCPGALPSLLHLGERAPGFAALEKGLLKDALAGESSEDKLLLTAFVGASDGASAGEIQGALQLSDSPELHGGNLWFLYALSLREERESEPLEKRLEGTLHGEEPALKAWLKEAPWKKDPKAALVGLKSAEFATLLACIADPRGVPASYREMARRWWLPGERPYLQPTPDGETLAL